MKVQQRHLKFLIIINILILIFFNSANSAEQLTYKKDGPNAEELGSLKNYPICGYIDHRKKAECRVGNFSGVAEKYKNITYRVKPSANKLKLPYYKNPPKKLLERADNFMNRNPVMALLIIKDGKRVLEKYQYGRNKDSRFKSFSVAKTFTGMLTGIAIEKGYIKSIDDTVGRYWPEIKNSEYGNITIKNLLRMSSTVFSEDDSINSGSSPTADMYLVLNEKSYYNKPEKFDDFINNIKKKNNYKQGSKKIYTSVDTEVLARTLVRATGKSIAKLTEEWLWKPMGGWSWASWFYSTTDLIENGASGFNATINDYGRFGVLLANDGMRDANQIIPKKFLLNATRKNRVDKNFLNKGEKFSYGYGYQTWIANIEDPTFCALGHYGQILCIQPSSKIVYVQFSAAGHHQSYSYKNLTSSSFNFLEYTLKILKN
tara:strand:- start:60 stop:1349 length:1290 start_codon:yes stop_codon:yes gene_type:complete